jgi:hypothetical protein
MAAGLSPFRIEVYETQVSDFGRGPFRAIIEDASDVGCSSYANDIGEVFFTIPMNHPQIDRIEPLASHIEVKRLDTSAQTYSSVWMGVLDDYDATTDEVVFYGHDYLGLLAKSIVPQATSATSAQIGLIINNTWTARKAETNSPVDFISTGSIATTSRTVTITAPFEEQLSFYAGLCDILAGAGTTRPMVYTSLAYPPSFNFSANRGVDTDAYPRIFMGGQILDFRYSPGLTPTSIRTSSIRPSSTVRPWRTPGTRTSGASVSTSRLHKGIPSPCKPGTSRGISETTSASLSNAASWTSMTPSTLSGVGNGSDEATGRRACSSTFNRK